MNKIFFDEIRISADEYDQIIGEQLFR